MNAPLNNPQLAAQPGGPMAEDEDSINLLELLDVVLDHRWLIAAITAVTLALGSAYALIATPIFEADTLIQVEDSKGNPMGALMGEAGSLFDVKSPATAEIEILRSRLVVGQAVANLQLDLTVTPQYIPVVGKWMARRATEPSTPAFMGLSGYVSGTESLQVAHFEVAPALEGQPFTVVLQNGGYQLQAEDGAALGQGRFGEVFSFKHMGASGELTLASAVGNSGAAFQIVKASHLRVTEGLQKGLKISEKGKQSGVLQVGLEGSNPELAAGILNEIGRLYVRQNTERKAAEAEKSITFLNTLLPNLKQELEASEGKFNQFRTQQGTFDLNTEAKALLDQSISMRVKLLELQQKRKELETRFTSQHPSVQALDAQIKDINAQTGSLEGKAKTLPRVEQDMLRLTRDVKVNNELYTNLLNSYQQLRLVKEGKVGNVRIVDVAVVPERPIKPQRQMVVALAGVLGVLAGLAAAFLRNSLRPGIRHPDELEQRLGLHVFATVPHSVHQLAMAADAKARKPGMHLLTAVHSDDPAVESMRSLRTALQFAMLDAPNNIVLVTGPTPGIGKSFVSANFAAVLAAGGKRVLLVDADMRKGHLNQFFGLERDHGLSELITGTQTLDEVVHRNLLPNLDLVTTGAMPPNPAELMMSPAFHKLLLSLAGQYDILLIDTPPVLAVADTAVVAPGAGTVFLVARSEVSTLAEVQETAKRLSQSGATVRGVIFNGLNINKRRYGYGYGYGYKYSRYRYKAYQYGDQ
jgi:tyrosine-protein kinase Etk/Wzc